MWEGVAGGWVVCCVGGCSWRLGGVLCGKSVAGDQCGMWEECLCLLIVLHRRDISDWRCW